MSNQRLAVRTVVGTNIWEFMLLAVHTVVGKHIWEFWIQTTRNKLSVARTTQNVTAVISSTFSSKLKLSSGTSGQHKVLVFLRILDNKGVLVNKRVLDSKRGLG